MKAQIQKLVDGHDLTDDESSGAMREIMDGSATPAQIAALITALRMKGETADEITGFARTRRCGWNIETCRWSLTKPPGR